MNTHTKVTYQYECQCCYQYMKTVNVYVDEEVNQYEYG